MTPPSESSLAAVREVLPCALNCEPLDGGTLHSLNCIHARPVYTERIVAHVVQYLDAQLAQARAVSKNRLAEAFIRGLEFGAESPKLAGDGDAMYQAFRDWWNGGQGGET